MSAQKCRNFIPCFSLLKKHDSEFADRLHRMNLRDLRMRGGTLWSPPRDCFGEICGRGSQGKETPAEVSEGLAVERCQDGEVMRGTTGAKA